MIWLLCTVADNEHTHTVISLECSSLFVLLGVIFCSQRIVRFLFFPFSQLAGVRMLDHSFTGLPNQCPLHIHSILHTQSIHSFLDFLLFFCPQTLVSSSSYTGFPSSILCTIPSQHPLLQLLWYHRPWAHSWWHQPSCDPATSPDSLTSNISFQWLRVFSSASLWSPMALVHEE